MAVSANRWHPLAFDARSYVLQRKVTRSLFSHMSGAVSPPRLLGAIDTRSPTTHPLTHPPTIFSVPFLPRCLDHGLLQSPRDRRRTHRAPSPAPSAVHLPSKAYAHRTVTGAVGSTPAIAGVRTRRRHRRRRQCTRDRRRTYRAPSPAPSQCTRNHRRGRTAPSPAPLGVSAPSHCKRIRKECGRLPTHI